MNPEEIVQQASLADLDGSIRDLKRAAVEIETNSAGFPAVHRNIRRVLASIAMLELNVSDMSDL